VRIGKEVDNPFKVGTTMRVWHGVDALFASFRKGAADKPRVGSTSELVGFDDLDDDDQENLAELIEAENEFRSALAKVDDDATRLEHPKNGGVFWSIVQADNTTRVRWGTIGEEGAVSEKEHADDATAAKFVAKKIADKEKGGYVKVGKASDSDESKNTKPIKSKKRKADDASSDDVDAAKTTTKPKSKKAKADPPPTTKAVVKKGDTTAPTAAVASSSDGDDTVHGWTVEYAKSGRSKCKATNEQIPQGAGEQPNQIYPNIILLCCTLLNSE
jgi:predicted DNA-binding WGR domain protein